MSALVLFRCPDTGEPVSTGITTDLIGLSRVVGCGVSFKCKACGSRHVLVPGATWLSLTQSTKPLSRRTAVGDFWQVREERRWKR